MFTGGVMRKTILFFGIFILIHFGTAAQDFEGVIYYEVAELSAAGMSEMAYMIKEGKARMEYGNEEQKSSVLFLPDKNQMVVMIHQMQGYMTMDIDDAEEMDESSESEQAENTGQTKTIAGRSCEVWRITDPEETYEVCVAKNMGNFVMPNTDEETPDWARELMEEGFMPLEVVTLENGGRSVDMRATRIEERNIDDSLFSIPEGYKDMTEMMNQMYQQNR